LQQSVLQRERGQRRWRDIQPGDHFSAATEFTQRRPPNRLRGHQVDQFQTALQRPSIFQRHVLHILRPVEFIQRHQELLVFGKRCESQPEAVMPTGHMIRGPNKVKSWKLVVGRERPRLKVESGRQKNRLVYSHYLLLLTSPSCPLTFTFHLQTSPSYLLTCPLPSSFPLLPSNYLLISSFFLLSPGPSVRRERRR